MRKNQRKMAIFKRLITQLNRWMIARQAPDLVRASYISLLEREPDPDGLRAYVQALRKHGDVTSMIKDIAQSDEHWDQLMAKRSAQLAHSFAQAFSARVTGNAPTPAHINAWSLSLQNPSEADALADSVLASRDLLKRVGELHANEWADSLYQGVLGRDASNHERQEFCIAFLEQELSSFIERLLDGRELHLRLHQKISPMLAEAACRVGYASEPNAQALMRAQSQYVLEESPQHNLLRIYEQSRREAELARVHVSTLLHRMHKLCVKTGTVPSALDIHIQAALSEEPKWLEHFTEWLIEQMRISKPAALPVAHTAAQPSVASKDGLELIEGWYSWEAGFAWGQEITRLRVSQPKMIWLSFANFRLMGLSEHESTRVTFTLDSQTRTIVDPDPSLAYGVYVGIDGEQELRVELTIPKSASRKNLASDPRKLYQHVALHQPPWGKRGGPLVFSEHLLVCVYCNQKDLQSMEPLIPALRSKGLSVILLAHTQLSNLLNATAFAATNWLISAAESYSFLERAGAKGKIIYLEHGIAPLKNHTYEAHYLRYNLTLLCSSLWTERLHQLYGSKVKAQSVGFSKLRQHTSLSPSQRAERLSQLNLKPNQPVILFAPSWSAGMRHAGIFNIQHIDPRFNVITVPHEGDWPFIAELSNKFNIHKQAPGETINDYYAIADIVISDISSTAIEAACLGKPVICMIPDGALPDIDPAAKESPTRLRIPHTDHYWDFCEVVIPSEINAAITKLIETLPKTPSSHLSEALDGQVPPHLKPWIDCYGDAATEKTCIAIKDFLLQTQNPSSPTDSIFAHERK